MTIIWDPCTFWRALGGICQPRLSSIWAIQKHAWLVKQCPATSWGEGLPEITKSN